MCIEGGQPRADGLLEFWSLPRFKQSFSLLILRAVLTLCKDDGRFPCPAALRSRGDEACGRPETRGGDRPAGRGCPGTGAVSRLHSQVLIPGPSHPLLDFLVTF